MIDLCAEDATILYAASNTRFIPLRVGNAGEWLRTMSFIMRAVIQH
jgi:hypothetical protein